MGIIPATIYIGYAMESDEVRSYPVCAVRGTLSAKCQDIFEKQTKAQISLIQL